ncbi:hypothetical protein [Methylobacterium frigidaeris]|jgi:hypothetical protein|uniref:Uncharacterized protein n=1 Tax=Methylobacterium frigidaeris TaxID=2038277 RepID=A0AA37M476_9HYPH|nr:hypothetical protein [Methylobacterium frigidaeris]PIK74740.1 hypothetical protein CS379_00820 [Methylobacterium frigidaeris]GJD62168.1 hypothetical protein MPEAHAMD_2319 [Methylobacterium frigidaeris]
MPGSRDDLLTARPHLTRSDEDEAAARVGVTPADHDAARKPDALDPGTTTTGDAPRPRPAPAGEGEV